MQTFVAVHQLLEISKQLNQENKLQQIDYYSEAGSKEEKKESQSLAKFPFRIAKEIEFINDRLKFTLKEMSAKFQSGNVAFVMSYQFRAQINQLMGQLNKYVYGLDSSQLSRNKIDHCHLQPHHFQELNPPFKIQEVLLNEVSPSLQSSTNFEHISKALLKKIQFLQS